MTRDEIIRMAREAGFEFPHEYDTSETTNRLESFAALVAAAEREECIYLLMRLHERQGEPVHNYYHYAANQLRARGEK